VRDGISPIAATGAATHCPRLKGEHVAGFAPFFAAAVRARRPFRLCVKSSPSVNIIDASHAGDLPELGPGCADLLHAEAR